MINAIQKKKKEYLSEVASPTFNIMNEYQAKNINISHFDLFRIEKTIDKYNSKLTSLNSFILPGGTITAAFLHNARTVTRRAETQMVSLAKNEKVNEEAIKYINRLSDLFFVLSRVENKNGKKDILWKPGKNV